MLLPPSFVIVWTIVAVTASTKSLGHEFKPANVSADIGFGKCNSSNVSMPQWKSSLPPPPSGQQLLHVAIGRGTLNYTCNQNTPTTAPAAQGAIAVFYDAICLAAFYPEIFTLIPDIALQFSLSTNISGSSPVSNILSFWNANIIGWHYFRNATFPDFDMDTKNGYFGKVSMTEVAQQNAPAYAPAGQAQVSTGAAPWAFYEYVNSSTIGNIRYVYRTNTAGGNPPQTCQGMPDAFTVEYAAQYWFWGLAGKTG